jgi:hypothetical protein
MAGSAERTPTRHRAREARSGLLEFDLGRIPAPVTPPRSSKHAGWFAAASSMIVGAALALLTSTLVGPPLAFRTVEALPGLPGMRLDGAPPVPNLTGANSTRAASGSGEHAPEPSVTPAPTSAGGVSVLPVAVGAAPEVAPTGHRRPGPDRPSSQRPSPSGGQPAEQAAPVAPIRETRPADSVPGMVAAGRQPADPDLLGDRAEAFYHLVISNPAAAYEMTSGDLRRRGVAAFRQQYSNMVRIEIKKITMSPAEGTAASLMVVTYDTGARITENRMIKFSDGDNPLIESEHIR